MPFKDNPQTEWLPDGRTMVLLRDLTYVDHVGKVYCAKRGRKVDGASIPRFLWRTIGPPFVGKYRFATIIHDVQCVDKEIPSNAVHLLFREMIEASGVPKYKVKFKAFSCPEGHW